MVLVVAGDLQVLLRLTNLLIAYIYIYIYVIYILLVIIYKSPK